LLDETGSSRSRQLLQRQSSARRTIPARSGFRSTYLNTATKCSSSWTGKP
jgi:hypothetical protein